MANVILGTRQSGISLTTTPTKIWTTPSSRVGIKIHADNGNGSNLLIARVAVGASAPTRPTDEITAGQTFNGDNSWNAAWDVYWWVKSGTGTGDADEIAN